MADVTTVKQLAEDVGIPVEKLINQLKEALQEEALTGASTNENEINPNHPISGQQKQQLLDYLKGAHGASLSESSPHKITLQRKQHTKVTAKEGHTVSVVVRKKRTYKKRVVKQEDEGSNSEIASPALPEEASEQIQNVETVAEQLSDTTETSNLSVDTHDATISVEAAPVEETPQSAENPVDELSGLKSEKLEKSVKAGDPVPSKNTSKKEKAKKSSEDEEAFSKKTKEFKKRATKSPTKVEIQRDLYELEDDTGFAESAQAVVTRKRKKTAKGSKHLFEKPVQPIIRDVSISESITVSELAQKMAVKAPIVIKTLMKMGTMANINHVLDQDTAVLVVEELGHRVNLVNSNALEDSLRDSFENRIGEIAGRAPVVTIMGHVDHGKTSLLDYIRRSQVTEQEAGGITQHIGAYVVDSPKGKITFLDTPGHSAFTAMRSRGANCTDIVILVVAADDGVMPQTIEAIQHAKAAQVPLIVAVNKMDKPEADPERVRSELSQHEVISEDWGGDTQFVPVSAKTGQGIDELLDAVLLQAELLELTAHQTGPATGVVIESRLDKGRGVVATLLIQQGVLRKGDIVLSGNEFGRVRAMLDEHNQPLECAGPSTPVEILGLSSTPAAGDEAVVVPDERKAREISEKRREKLKVEKLARQSAIKLENLFEQAKLGECVTLNVLLKADVQGSVEALSDALTQLGTDEAKINLIGSSVGGINESDIHLAVASNALIIGFNVRADASARRLLEEEGAEVKYFSVIYDVIDTVKSALTGMLSPVIKEKIIGLAEVRDVFRSAKFGAIAGCMVLEGIVKRNSPIRVLRNNVVIYEGELESLKRFKEDAMEVRNGMECGIGVKNYNDVKVQDQIEVFEKVEVARQL